MMLQETVNTTQVNPQPKRFILNDSASNTEIVFLPQVPSFAAPQLDYQGLEGKFTFQGMKFVNRELLLAYSSP